jgi:microcystin-dependent protein
VTEPFLGEIRAVGYNFAPVGWALCDGQLIPLSQNTALFSLLGTTYGGNGVNNFALPNLQGLSPIHPGQGPGLSLVDLGETGGSETVTLLPSEIPAHTHTVGVVDASGSSNSPLGAAPATARYGRVGERLYAAAPDGTTTMHRSLLSLTGGGLPHNNMPPYLVVNFIIAMQGIFPPRG